jgi:hypothetical protein
MGLLEYLRRQFAYNAWAKREVLAALKASNQSTPRSRQLLAHVLSAERLWLERIRKQPQGLPVWPDFSYEQCDAQLSELDPCGANISASFLPGPLGERSIQKQQGRGLDQHSAGHPDSRVVALGLSSRADRQPGAQVGNNPPIPTSFIPHALLERKN